MSLILEALRKSEAEREIGSVPTLQARAASLDEADLQPTLQALERARRRSWIAAGAAAGLAALVGIVLLAPRPVPDGPALASAAPATPPAAAPPVTPAKPVPGAAADESPTPASLAREPQLVRPVGPAAVSTVREPAQTAARRDPPAAASARREAPAAPSARREPPARDDAPPRPAAVAKAPVAPAATAKSDDASAGAVPGIDDLPADVRRRLPVLTVGGSAYSADPASRMLILNGQVLREGDAVAADVVLERIQLRSAVLRAGDLRYRISF